MELKVKAEHRRMEPGRFMKNPARVIVVSFALIIAVGTLLLTMPFSSRTGEFTNLADAFFTATSATCVTGLIVVDTYLHFSPLGQVIILMLIQFGGLGLVTITTFFNLAIRRKLGFQSMQIAQESVSTSNMSDVSALVKMIIGLTLSIELLGAVVLATVFVPQYGAHGIFISIFLAISAFCNAGFDILGMQGEYSSLIHYFDNPVVLIMIMMLIIFGGLGFIVWHDLYDYFKTKRMMLHSKIVLVGTVSLILVGAVTILLMEWSNPDTIGGMTFGQKLLNSFFLSVSCRTAGFNSFDLNSMNEVTKIFSSILMFIGAAPGGTGGGVKVTTFVVLFMTVVCALRGRDETLVWDRRVDKSVIYKALAITAVAMLAVLGATGFISMTIHDGGVTVSGVDALFESSSAFATVGLSTGVTGVANLSSRMILAATMFLGRVGPVSLALSLSMRANLNKHQVRPEGKIMVG